MQAGGRTVEQYCLEKKRNVLWNLTQRLPKLVAYSSNQTPLAGERLMGIFRSHSWMTSQSLGSPGQCSRTYCCPGYQRITTGTSSSSWCKGLQHHCITERPTPRTQHRTAGLGLWVLKSRASGIPPFQEVPLTLGRFHLHLGDSVILLPLRNFPQVILSILGKHPHRLIESSVSLSQ